jgi:hypothetical protein
LVFVEERNKLKKPRASANGRRWSALGFFQRKSHFGHSSPPVRVGTRSSARGILAFSRNNEMKEEGI